MPQIALSRGLFATVDDDDLELLSQFKWHVQPISSDYGGFYALTGRGGAKPTNGGRIYMHRLLMGAKEGEYVDHIDRDGLNNRRANLRLASKSENNCNRRAPKSATGFRGVHPDGRGRYTGRVYVAGKPIYTAHFDTPDEAAAAYDQLARSTYGEFAVLNFGAAA